LPSFNRLDDDPQASVDSRVIHRPDDCRLWYPCVLGNDLIRVCGFTPSFVFFRLMFFLFVQSAPLCLWQRSSIPLWICSFLSSGRLPRRVSDNVHHVFRRRAGEGESSPPHHAQCALFRKLGHCRSAQIPDESVLLNLLNEDLPFFWSGVKVADVNCLDFAP